MANWRMSQGYTTSELSYGDQTQGVASSFLTYWGHLDFHFFYREFKFKEESCIAWHHE